VPKGLYLWGGVGRGKSMLMDLFHASVAIEEKRRVHFHAFMQEVQAGLNDARKRGVDDAILPVADRIAGEVRLLSFDEMQITDIADAMIVGRLFQKLFEAGVVIVTTSNRPPDDLYKDGLNRPLFLPFIALLKDRMAVRELAADRDYRQDRLAGSPVYFHPADAAARDAVSDIWRDVSGGGGGQPADPEGQGPRRGDPGVPQRCGPGVLLGPLRPAARPGRLPRHRGALRLLILEGVPRLSSENYNEAKRFVTLIDALYEAKVRLVMTAADIPERLYIEGEGAFEFERDGQPPERDAVGGLGA
jgi:cell division protein ZapE